jgi:hypothetical protein
LFAGDIRFICCDRNAAPPPFIRRKLTGFIHESNSLRGPIGFGTTLAY